jgi:DNA helicase HerA-like ATPase
MSEEVVVGGGGEDYKDPQHLLLKYGNRHGLIAGATGTGKTVTLQVLAESLSANGIPVFLTDVKGDLAGLSQPGSPDAETDKPFKERAAKIGLADYAYAACPVTFWDVFGASGHPVRTTLTEMGPMLLARLFELSDAQEGVLNIVFRVADDEGLALLDLADLKALLNWMGENRAEVEKEYGAISSASIGAIQRRLLTFENDGGTQFFGEPALELADLLRQQDGKGVVSILAADRLMRSPRLYATVLLWLLSELFEVLPEVGDPDKPKLVLFFDEAHLIFDDAPKTLLDKLEQVARLIRSKGVGVFFVTQNPADVPEDILGQLGNRVQHALRAFTAKDRQALRQAAQTYRDNPRFDIETAIREVGTGEAVTSLLEAKGAPGMAERTLICPPRSRPGTITDAERDACRAASGMGGKYDQPVDRDSAAEKLKARTEEAAKAAEQTPTISREDLSAHARATKYSAPKRSSRRGDSVGEAFAKSLARQLGSNTGKAIVRGVLGGLFRGR